MSLIFDDLRPSDLQLNENHFCETLGHVDAFEDVFGDTDSWGGVFGNLLPVDDNGAARFRSPSPDAPEFLVVDQLTAGIEPLEPSILSASGASPGTSLESSEFGLLRISNVAVKTLYSRDKTHSMLGTLNDSSLLLSNTHQTHGLRFASPASESFSLKSFTNTGIVSSGGCPSLSNVPVTKSLLVPEHAKNTFRDTGSRGGTMQSLSEPAKDNAEGSQQKRRRRRSDKTDRDSHSAEPKKRTRVDIKKREQGPNPHGRKGTETCAHCRRRNSKCKFRNKWLPCEFCQERHIQEPCFKLPPPKALARLGNLRAFPRFTNTTLASEDALLLQSAYHPGTSSPRTRAFVRQVAKAYGEDLPHLSLRHSILAFAASLLPPADFELRSEIHIQKSTQALIKQTINPNKLHEADLFAAGMLMWVLWIKNRPKNALRHAMGIMIMLQQFKERAEKDKLEGGSGMSDMLTVFAPLVYSEARFYGALGLDSEISPELFKQRTTFTQRVKYQTELICSGSETVPWLSGKCQGLIDALWDIQWLLLSYVSALTTGDAISAANLPSALEHVKKEYNDPDLRMAISHLEDDADHRSGDRNSVEGEVMGYLRIKKLSIDLLICVLDSSDILEGFRSLTAYDIAREQLAFGAQARIQREGIAHEFYTWTYVIDLGLIGLALAVYGDGRECGWVLEELQERGKPQIKTAIESYWTHQDLMETNEVIELVLGEASRRFVYGGPIAKP